MSKRIVCFMAAIALIVASAVPAYAVTPQEGWFISGTMERDGINYYIIDNKVNDQKWWVDLNGGYVRLDEVYEAGYSDTFGNMSGIMEGVQGFYYMREAYRGFTPDKDWRIDNDWLIEVSVSSASCSVINASGKLINPAIFGITFLAFDRSKLPTVSADYESFNSAYGNDSAFTIEQGVYNIIPAYGSTKLLGPSYSYSSASNDSNSPVYFPVSNFSANGLFTGADIAGSILGEEGINSFDLDGCSINDLVIFPSGTATDSALSYDYNVRCFFRFLCPVDKAPAGMAVGDRWPKVWPLEVEMEDAYQEYYNAMLDWSQTPTPDTIHNKFDSMSIWGDDALGALEFDDQQSEFVGLCFSLISPLVNLLFPVLFLGILALIFVNKAMH